MPTENSLGKHECIVSMLTTGSDITIADTEKLID